MFYVMILTVCIASPVIAHKDLCKVFIEDIPFVTLDECMTQGRMIAQTLKQEGYYIFNIPGGPNVSLGGAIAGNVHGRISNKSYPNFGDNVHSFKIIDNNFQI